MKKESKILFLLHLPPPVHGSSVVGKFIHDSILINSSFRARYVDLGTSISIDDIGRNSVRKVLRYFNINIGVLREIIFNRPALCYFPITAKGIGFYKDAVVALLIKAFGVKLVFHFHNKGVSQMQNRFFDNLLYSIVFKRANAILLSKHLYFDVQKYFPLSKVYYCPNGIPALSSPWAFKKNCSSQVAQILFLSNLLEAKGVNVLLESCKLLQERGIKFYCTFVGGEGDISAKQFDAKVQKLGILNKVKYLGKRYGEEKEQIFSISDIFVFPTLNEAFGLVNLEAMQFGLPIVASNEGGIPDIIEDGYNGYLIDKNDAVALSDRLEELIKNPKLRQEMGLNGQEKYKKHFTLGVFEANLNGILQEIVSQNQ